MITDAILSLVSAPIYYILKLLSLPVVGNLEIPADAFNGLSGFCANVAYIFPVRTLIAIPIFFAALDSFRPVWALILKIKSFIF